MSDWKTAYGQIFFRRLAAFVIDTTLFLSVFTILIRIFNLFMPGNDVPRRAMQLFTKKDFNVFIATMIAALLLLSCYLLMSYLYQRGQTLGHRLFGVRLVNKNNESPSKLHGSLLILLSIFRCLIVIVPGPFLAKFGFGVTYSVFALFWGIAVVLPLPISGSRDFQTAWQRLGRYKFVLQKSSANEDLAH